MGGSPTTLRRHARSLIAALLLAVAGPAAALGQEPPAKPAGGDQLERRQATVPPVDTDALVSVNAALRGAVQWIANSDTARGAVFGAGSLDVNVIVRPADNARLFLDVEGLVGPGPDQRLGTLSRLNFDAERLNGHDKGLLLKELWLRLAFDEGRVRFNIGKLDVTHYFDRNFFAEDDTTQFLDSALLGNPMLKPPPNGPGTALRVSVGDWRYAFGVHAPGDVDDDLSGLPFFIGELGRRNIFSLRGHYRLWARVGSVPENRDHSTWGSGISIDQLATPDVGLFLRAGLSRSEGEPLTSYAWSAGTQLTPTWIDRGKDRAGIGYGVQREPAGREHVVEAYYTFAAAEWLSLTANIQWVVSGPNQVTGGTNRNVVVPGFRVLCSF